MPLAFAQRIPVSLSPLFKLRACSSVGQSRRLIISWSGVQVPPGPPPFSLIKPNVYRVYISSPCLLWILSVSFCGICLPCRSTTETPQARREGDTPRTKSPIISPILEASPQTHIGHFAPFACESGVLLATFPALCKRTCSRSRNERSLIGQLGGNMVSVWGCIFGIMVIPHIHA